MFHYLYCNKKEMRQFVFTLTGLFYFSIASAQTEIYSTNFQNGIPSNFAIIDNDGFTPELVVSEFSSAWIPYVDPDNTNDSIAASTSYFNPPNTASRWLITPPLALSSYGNYIEWQAKSHDASYPDDYLVLISTTDNQLSSFTDTIGYIIEENFEWATRQINLSAQGYNNQTVYVAFVNVTTDGFKLYLDDIRAWIEDPAYLSELEEKRISVYPNPVQHTLHINAEIGIDFIEIEQPDGTIVLSSSETTYNISDLPAGIYFVIIHCKDGVFTRKIIKI